MSDSKSPPTDEKFGKPPNKGFWVGFLKLKDKEKLQKEYLPVLKQCLLQYQGKIVSRGPLQGPDAVPHVERPEDYDGALVIEFPTFKQATDCYKCEAYQNVVPIRDSALELALCVMEGLHAANVFKYKAVMSLFVKVTDPSLFKEYVQAVGPTTVQDGEQLGTVIASAGVAEGSKDDAVSVISGRANTYQKCVLIGFTDIAGFKKWYDSASYQAIVQKRLNATTGPCMAAAIAE